MCPRCVSVQTSASQALGVWERLEASRDLRGDAGKTFGKRCRGDALLVAAAFRPTPAVGATGNYFNKILGEYRAENLIPNPKTLILWKCRAMDGSCAWWESHLIPWGLVFFFPGSSEVWVFFLFCSLCNFFSPPSSLSFLLIRSCWGTVSIQKQNAPRWLFPSAASFRGREKESGEGRRGGESEDA